MLRRRSQAPALLPAPTQLPHVAMHAAAPERAAKRATLRPCHP